MSRLLRTLPTRRARLAAACVLALATGVAHASDGVLELSHTCATTTGCVAGDAPGYPITLDGEAGRSYQLTSDLRVPISVHGIVVGASGVTIDLGGFTIAQECTWLRADGGNVPLCPLTGDGDGIRTTSNGSIEGVQVRNGTIHYMGGMGLFLGRESIIESVIVRECGSNGIYVGAGSIVSKSVSDENASWGYFGHGTLTASIARGNQTGIHWQGTITHNSISSSQVFGIQAGPGSLVTNNSVSHSDVAGIHCNRDCRIADNAVYQSGTHSTDYGIECYGGCSVVGNMIHDSGGYGLKFWDAEGSYRGNTISDSGVASVDGGLNLGGNACNGAVCP